jgi:hydrazine synthase alpha subunit-like protein
MGRLSTVDPSKKTGILLCLDARRNSESDSPLPVARVRILAGRAGGAESLGEIPVATDGSFLAEVPADVPLGIEALDEGGRVVRAFAPWIWVRPGENRACIGCHEPHGIAPRNQRPLAVKLPAVRLALPAAVADVRTRGGM